MRFNEYKSLQEELTQLENAYRDAVERRAKLEATERARTPTVRMLEAATVPREVWRPLYLRDAGLSIVAALLAALLAVWLVELFNRPEPQPSVVIAQPVVSGVLVHGGPRPVALPGQGHAALEPPDRALLPPPPALPRELEGDEIDALVRAGEGDARLAMLLLLHGVAPEELAELRRDDVDLERRVIRVGGEWSREIPVGGALGTRARRDARLAGRAAHRRARWAAGDAGRPRGSDSLRRARRRDRAARGAHSGRSAAHVHRISRAPGNPLCRPGARGRPSTGGRARRVRDLAPAGPRAALDAIQLVLPPLRGPRAGPAAAG